MTKEFFSAYAKIPQCRAASVYFCGREKCEGGHSYGPMMRTQYLFHYIVSGKGTFRTKNAAHHLSAGQGFLICPDQMTYYEADKENPWEYIWIGFDGTEVAEILADVGLTEKRPIYKGEPDGILEGILIKLVDIFEQDSNDKYNALALFYSAMAFMQAGTSSRRLGEKGYIDKALDYIHHNYTYRIRIEDIARYVGLDRTYLFKLFVKNVGTAPQEYLIRYRLEHAANLLKETKLSTTQIAYSCGFRDSPSFCKHFKARYDISPLAYRKQINTNEQ
ncbi:MAG: AraC family transcriptional regulator [Clostridia bacterium]|nr:AraC family transcriptional regulator [Clostridia bacterium]